VTGSRTIAVTGATRGLGRALAERFAAEGHRVAGCGRNGAAAEELAQRLGAEHDIAVADVTAPDLDSWAARVIERFGPPDILVNNAGVINQPRNLWEVPAAEFDAVIDVNVRGVWRVLRLFLPGMIERGRGVVVDMSSGWGRSVAPGVGPYCASKFAVEGMTAALAQELPEGLAAIALNPGVIATDMLRRVWRGGAASYESPADWARRAAPFIVALGPGDNGASLTVPS
jgi:NAD(P)-dependent dehydrogenase (short-subunit alcohol dehydrogenase family)